MIMVTSYEDADDNAADKRNAQAGSEVPSLKRKRTDTAPKSGPQHKKPRTAAAGAAPASPISGDFHQAVLSRDINRIRALISGGGRPVEVNEQRQSPMDLLDTMSDVEPATKREMRSALLASQNSTAPAGYVKPEAFHASPWGAEILETGALKGGVNDAKGGAQSLEGKVFFSDRTPENDGHARTRATLRSKARHYAEGTGLRSSTPANRALQYRAVLALDQAKANRTAWNITGAPLAMEMETVSSESLENKLKSELQELCTNLGFADRDIAGLSLEELAGKVELPGRVTVTSPGGDQLADISGKELGDLYVKAGASLRADLENGKAPYLSLINDGKVVPMVFGFEKVSGLKTHTIVSKFTKANDKNYSYQDEAHPLSGSARGGKLKEIEIKSLQDLATLTVGLLAKGANLPDDVVIRVNPHSKRVKAQTGVRAEYLTTNQVKGFQANVAQHIAEMEGIQQEEVSGHIAQAPIAALQNINGRVRSLDLAGLVPERESNKDESR
jgi:hypothetical protein